MLSCLNELMSMNILYPGLLGTCFCFLFGTLACLIFAYAHTSHGSSFPVFLIPMFSDVVFRRCSPVCPVIWCNFHIGINPDGIILSNFMLALVVLNSSIIRPPSFHLPFISHPSFIAFVKLKRSWFN